MCKFTFISVPIRLFKSYCTYHLSCVDGKALMAQPSIAVEGTSDICNWQNCKFCTSAQHVTAFVLLLTLLFLCRFCNVSCLDKHVLQDKQAFPLPPGALASFSSLSGGVQCDYSG